MATLLDFSPKAMHCPRCGDKDTRVIDSRIAKNGFIIRRRRACPKCDYRFTTTEEIVREGLMVVKRDGRREEFDRGKLVGAIRRACHKRPVDLEQIDLLVSDVLVALEGQFDQEIPVEAIGDQVMERLRTVDKIAYVRFASVYKDFRDIDELERELSELRKRSETK